MIAAKRASRRGVPSVRRPASQSSQRMSVTPVVATREALADALDAVDVDAEALRDGAARFVAIEGLLEALAVVVVLLDELCDALV